MERTLHYWLTGFWFHGEKGVTTVTEYLIDPKDGSDESIDTNDYLLLLQAPRNNANTPSRLTIILQSVTAK